MTITCDQYPYTATSTSMTALLPHWAHDGGVPALLQRLKEPTQRLKEETGVEMENRGGPASILVSGTHGYHPEWEGKTVEQLSQEFQMDPVDTVDPGLCSVALGGLHLFLHQRGGYAPHHVGYGHLRGERRLQLFL